MICKCCGKEFTKTKNNQRYCSPECKANAAYEQSQNSYLKHREETKARNRKIAAIKSSWLTVPDAPNYEISPDLQVRRKSDGKIIATYTRKNKKLPICNLHHNKKQMIRSVTSWRNQAEAAALAELADEWFPVPSLDNRYEFNNKNQLRNARTKQLIALTPNRKAYKTTVNGKCRYNCITSLRWEIFGEIPPKGIHVKKPVIISKGKTTRYFDSHLDAIKYIAAHEFFSISRISGLMSKRQNQIFGWTINYLENQITQVGDYLKGMQTKDPRKAKTK